MTATIHYEGLNGEERTIERDGWHTEKNGVVIAYDKQTSRETVAIPTNRVVIIHDASERDTTPSNYE